MGWIKDYVEMKDAESFGTGNGPKVEVVSQIYATRDANGDLALSETVPEGYTREDFSPTVDETRA